MKFRVSGLLAIPAFVVACLLGGAMPACSQSIVGTWSMRTNALNRVPFSFEEVTFYPNGTFKKVVQTNNSQERAIGRYKFDGSTLFYIVDDYTPRYHPERDPAYHNQVSTPVQVGQYEMVINGEHWHRH